MTTIANSTFEINGLVDTGQTVMTNMTNLANACGVWITYDITTGTWSVVINKPSPGIKSFNNNNIIGNINVSGTGLTEAYNKATAEINHKDLRGEIDFIDIIIPYVDRYPNEIDNTLNIKYDLVNDPIQAQYLSSIELKQSRIDRIIEFRSDYTALGLSAGDLITITNDTYGFTDKQFRIVSITEDDTADGTIECSIRALEYDENVYNSNGLQRSERIRKTGITPQNINQAVIASNDVSVGNQLSRLLIANGALSLLGWLFKRIGNSDLFGPSDEGEVLDKTLRSIKKPSLDEITASSFVCEGDTINFVITHSCQNTCFLTVPDFNYPYKISGIGSGDIDTLAINGQEVDKGKLEGTLKVVSGTATVSIKIKKPIESGKTVTLKVGDKEKSATVKNIPDFTYTTTAASGSISEGSSVVVNLTTTGIENGTPIPYTITGSAVGKITTPLTGEVTINSNAASLTVSTTDDGVHTGDQTFTVKFADYLDTNCGSIDNESAVVVTDNSPADSNCVTVTIPVGWCPVYDGSTGAVKGLTVIRSATVYAARSGGPKVTVPTAVSVSSGTVTITSTVDVDATSNKGGIDYQVITSFNSIPAHGYPTGTTTTVRGY